MPWPSGPTNTISRSPEAPNYQVRRIELWFRARQTFCRNKGSFLSTTMLAKQPSSYAAHYLSRGIIHNLEFAKICPKDLSNNEQNKCHVQRSLKYNASPTGNFNCDCFQISCKRNTYRVCIGRDGMQATSGRHFS